MLWDLSVEKIQEQEDCANTDALLRWACLCVFTAGTLNDLVQSVNMCIWLYLVPTVRRHIAVGYEVNGHGQRVLDSQWGLTASHKTFVSVGVLLPKFAIAGFMFVIGAAYLSISESNDVLILNTVALNFILDIDELLYKVFVSDFVKECVEQLPPFDLRRPNEQPISPVKRLTQSLQSVGRIVPARCAWPVWLLVVNAHRTASL